VLNLNYAYSPSKKKHREEDLMGLPIKPSHTNQSFTSKYLHAIQSNKERSKNVATHLAIAESIAVHLAIIASPIILFGTLTLDCLSSCVENDEKELNPNSSYIKQQVTHLSAAALPAEAEVAEITQIAQIARAATPEPTLPVLESGPQVQIEKQEQSIILLAQQALQPLRQPSPRPAPIVIVKTGFFDSPSSSESSSPTSPSGSYIQVEHVDCKAPTAEATTFWPFS
jgi:hypothetical protein